MNKFCKSSLCVEKVRESYVLIGRRVVVVPGGADAVRLAVLELISVKLRLCRLLALRVLALASPARTTHSDFLTNLNLAPGTC